MQPEVRQRGIQPLGEERNGVKRGMVLSRGGLRESGLFERSVTERNKNIGDRYGYRGF